MALVLTRVAGESIRVTDKRTDQHFNLHICEVRDNGVFAEIRYKGRATECHIDFEQTQILLEGKLAFYKGFRGRGQVRCVFDMPAHINIVRTELLK